MRLNLSLLPVTGGIFIFKKASAVLLCIFMCISFFGCSADKKTETGANNSTVSNSAAASSVSESVTEKADAKSTVSQNADENKNHSSGANSQNSKSTSGANRNNENRTTEKENRTQNTTAAKTTKAPSKTTTKKVATTSSEISCTVTIECKSILNNMDNLKEGHEDYVPDDGVMLSNYSVTVENGDSVYDAVKSACSNNAININSQSSSYGVYIVGFNNIDEKDCGKESGWKYKVNGKYPSKSCNKYTVSNGDNIVFTYTCSY